MKRVLGLVIFAFLMTGISGEAMARAAKISDGKTVQIEYTLKIDGEVIETTDDKGPLKYVHGEGNLIPGLANGLEGLEVGDKKKIVVQPQDAYGPVNANAFREFPKSVLPPDFEVRQGVVLQLRSPEGGSAPCIVWEVKDESVVLNFNHPLAGKELHYDVKVVKIE